MDSENRDLSLDERTVAGYTKSYASAGHTILVVDDAIIQKIAGLMKTIVSACVVFIVRATYARGIQN